MRDTKKPATLLTHIEARTSKRGNGKVIQYDRAAASHTLANTKAGNRRCDRALPKQIADSQLRGSSRRTENTMGQKTNFSHLHVR